MKVTHKPPEGFVDRVRILNYNYFILIILTYNIPMLLLYNVTEGDLMYIMKKNKNIFL